ncbi:hypothetical protein HZS_7810 [Henneguya salminicola]|nr:hypothetical protein HZS_7810 [Henneguya salminicola]
MDTLLKILIFINFSLNLAFVYFPHFYPLHTRSQCNQWNSNRTKFTGLIDKVDLQKTVNLSTKNNTCLILCHSLVQLTINDLLYYGLSSVPIIVIFDGKPRPPLMLDLDNPIKSILSTTNIPINPSNISVTENLEDFFNVYVPVYSFEVILCGVLISGIFMLYFITKFQLYNLFGDLYHIVILALKYLRKLFEFNRPIRFIKKIQ